MAYDNRNSEPDATWNNKSRNGKQVSVLYLNRENVADHHVHLEDRRDETMNNNNNEDEDEDEDTKTAARQRTRINLGFFSSLR